MNSESSHKRSQLLLENCAAMMHQFAVHVWAEITGHLLIGP
jgi:hypothetical protein